MREVDEVNGSKQFKRVGTHSGKFHADEVMATAILKEVFDIAVIRTRDPEILGSLDLVYDVGGGEFDHHGVEKECRDSGTPYAACGLIWRRFGREAVIYSEPSLPEEEAEEVFRYVDTALIEGIDAVDNGLKTSETIIPIMSISSIISGFNPTWDSDKIENDAFNEAVEFARAILKNMIHQQISAVKARRYVIEAYNNRTKPELLILDKLYPWSGTLYDIDAENEVLFVIYPRDGEYLIQTVRENGRPYMDKKKLPQSWAGKREDELGKIIGISDAIFCHPSRFIAGARSFESIMKMADIAISERDELAPRGFLATLKEILFKKRVVIRK